MKDRIKHFIETKGISAGEFADVIDVQRSNISHILNGRNKPSASFIEKLLNAFPDLNARWLMTGNGEMFYTKQSASSVGQLPLDFKSVSAKNERIEEEVEVEYHTNKIATEKQTDNLPQEPTLTVTADKKDAVSNEPDIDRIVVLYKDGSFSSYKPR